MSSVAPQIAALMRLREEQPELALRQAEAMLRACDEFSPPAEVVPLHLVTSWVFETQGDWLPALEAATRATRLAEPLGGDLAAQAWIRLASVQSQLQAYTDALACIEMAGNSLAHQREPVPATQEKLRYITLCVLEGAGRWDEAQAVAATTPDHSSPQHRFAMAYAMVNACLRRADSQGADHWLQHCTPCAHTGQQQACVVSAQMSRHRLVQDVPAAEALLRWANARLDAFPAVLTQMRVLMAEAYAAQGQALEAQHLLDSVHPQADSLTTDEQAVYWRVRADVSQALGLSAQAHGAQQRAAACAQAAHRLLNDYQVKSAQLTLNHLDARLLLARTAQEVQQLRKAVHHHEALLSRMAPPAQQAPSLLAELLVDRHLADLRLPTGLLDLHRLGFRLLFQPIVGLQQARWLSCEALLRLSHPQWGHLAPAEVVPRLERAGDMADVGPWILDQACQALQRLQARGEPAPRMAINLTRSQLQASAWPTQALAILARYGLAPTQVEWEISEAMAVDDDAEVRGGLTTLRELGFGLSVDDYGTGYCNVARLIELAPQGVKIDRSLVQAAQHGAGDERALKSLIQSSHAMEMRVTAVGVESPAMLQRLHSLGCDAVQGYGVARPLPLSSLVRWQPAHHQGRR